MKNMIHRFSVTVNCNLSNESLVTDRQQDFEKLYEDNGFIILPENYSENGAPTGLVINCHGAGGTVTTDDSQVEHQALTEYLVANGYAVMDVNGLPKTALGKIYGLDTDSSGEYIYDEKKISGYNPAKNKKAETYPVPVKFWHCIDDKTVSYETTKKFVDMIKANGGVAELRTLPYGGHEPQLVGDIIDNPCGVSVFQGNQIEIRPAVEETFIWIKNFS